MQPSDSSVGVADYASDDVVVMRHVMPGQTNNTSSDKNTAAANTAPAPDKNNKNSLQQATLPKIHTESAQDDGHLRPGIEANMHRDNRSSHAASPSSPSPPPPLMHNNSVQSLSSTTEANSRTRQSSMQGNLRSPRSSKTSLAIPSADSFESQPGAKTRLPGTEEPKSEDQKLLDAIGRKFEAQQQTEGASYAQNLLSPVLPKSTSNPNASSTTAAGISVNVRDIDDAMSEIGNTIRSTNEESEHTLAAAGLQRKPQVNFDPAKYRQANQAGPAPTTRLQRADSDEAIESGELQLESGGSLGDAGASKRGRTSDADSLDIGLDDVDEALMKEIESTLATI